MRSASTSAESVQANFRFRCIGCGRLSDRAGQDFRCNDCADLLEITYPDWEGVRPDPQNLKSTWCQRRLSQSAIDLSGVWRFRELLPALDSGDEAVTLHEGNTPLY